VFNPAAIFAENLIDDAPAHHGLKQDKKRQNQNDPAHPPISTT
jgi:hypothetical protein